MRVHRVNCGSFHPAIGATVRHRDGRGFLPSRCLVIEAPPGIVLVDTGFGTEDVADATRRMGRLFLALTRPRLDAAETMVARLRALHLDPTRVTDIVLTHLDLDHAGGIPDFPNARIHVHRHELDTVRGELRAIQRMRYVPAHWAHTPQWVPFETGSDVALGFPASALDGLPTEIRVVALPGHSRGHVGVLVDHDEGRILHVGDACTEIGELIDERFAPALPARFHHVVFDANRTEAAETRRRLLRVIASAATPLTVVNSHDARMRTPDGAVVVDPLVDARE